MKIKAACTQKVNNTKLGILVFLTKVRKKGGKNYFTPSVESIKNSLKAFHNLSVNKSWIYKCLADLDETGFITRQKRYVRLPGGQFKSKISMLSFTYKGIKWLHALGIPDLNGLMKSMLSFAKSGDKRWPKEKDINPRTADTSGKTKLTELGDILPGIV